MGLQPALWASPIVFHPIFQRQETIMSHNVVSILKDLIKTCSDGEKGFHNGSQDARDPELKDALAQCARECTVAVSELQRCAAAYGATPEHEGTISGAIQRGWAELKTSMSSNKDLAILQACERGEAMAEKAYRQALEKDLPTDARAIVERQLQSVMKSHEQIKAMRDARIAVKQ